MHSHILWRTNVMTLSLVSATSGVVQEAAISSQHERVEA